MRKKTNKRKVALYLRVSTPSQAKEEKTSLNGQEKLCRDKALELGYKEEDILVYKEPGFSGEDIDVRKSLTKLRQDVADGSIDRVICTHPDRFSRDMTDKLIVCRELEKHEADIAFTDAEFNKSPEGILFFNIISAIAAYELALIKKRTVRGRLDKVRHHKKIMPMRVEPYGYDLNKGELSINENEAKFVKMVYEWYVYDRLTLRQIGEKLYKLGAIPKRKESNNWNQSSISKILTSEIYIGKYYYNRRKTQKERGKTTKSGNPRKSYTIREEKDWILVEVPAIIDEGLFKLAQEQRQRNKKMSGNRKYNYLLKSLIKCGHCGRTIGCTTYNGKKDKETGEKMKYTCYRCPNINPRKYGDEIEKCKSQTIRTDVLDEVVWNTVIESLTNEEEIMEKLKSNNKPNEKVADMIKILEDQMEQKKKEKEKIKIMFRKDFISEDEMDTDMKKVNNDIDSLKKEIAYYEDKIGETLKDEQAIKRFKHVIRKINQYKEKDEISFDEKRMLIESLVDEIIVSFEDKDQISLSFVGHLNDLLDDDYLHDIEFTTSKQYKHESTSKISFIYEALMEIRHVKAPNGNNAWKKIIGDEIRTSLMIK